MASKRAAMNRVIAYFLSFVALSAACGGEQPPPATSPSSPTPTSTEAPGAASAAPTTSASAPAPSAAPAGSAPSASGAPEAPGPGQWDAWTKEQKMAYMKSAVMPKMGPLFHEFDAKTYSEPKCVLCHGPGAREGVFKMPNPKLPKLLPTPEGFKKLQEQKPEVFAFMAKQVEPTMATLLGEQPYDPKTQKGFGCFDCHTKK